CKIFLRLHIDVYQSIKEAVTMTPKVHVSLDVENVEESVRFYSTLFGTQPTKLKPPDAKFDLDHPAINLTMHEKKHCCLQGLSHMGIRVDSNEQVLAY